MAPMLSLTEVQNLNKESLFRFLAISLPEGAQIDYKESISGNNPDKAHKEFLKDVTAFANAHGGLLLLGVREPSAGSSPQKQALGIPDGDKEAKTLERVAASAVDPRIPGLLIRPIQIESNRYVIVVYIPPSLIRPHMVSFQKHRSFYIRHSESSVPMSTHEIRDTVLSSATTEAHARAYAQEEEIDSLEYTIKEQPAFLIQAVPLLSLETPWDVLSRPIENIMRGEDRSNRYKTYCCLESGLRPTPTIKGALELDSRENQKWSIEVHRTGFVQTIYLDIQRKTGDQSKFELHDGYVDLLRAFCDLCESLWGATQTDMPYLFRCKYYNAEQTCFLKNWPVNSYTNIYAKRVISLPEQLRQTGESANEIPKLWGERLLNAFGLNWQLPDGRQT